MRRIDFASLAVTAACLPMTRILIFYESEMICR